jgi:hypothetical protein
MEFMARKSVMKLGWVATAAGVGARKAEVAFNAPPEMT